MIRYSQPWHQWHKWDDDLWKQFRHPVHSLMPVVPTTKTVQSEKHLCARVKSDFVFPALVDPVSGEWIEGNQKRGDGASTTPLFCSLTASSVSSTDLGSGHQDVCDEGYVVVTDDATDKKDVPSRAKTDTTHTCRVFSYEKSIVARLTARFFPRAENDAPTVKENTI